MNNSTELVTSGERPHLEIYLTAQWQGATTAPPSLEPGLKRRYSLAVVVTMSGRGILTNRSQHR